MIRNAEGRILRVVLARELEWMEQLTGSNPVPDHRGRICILWCVDPQRTGPTDADASYHQRDDDDGGGSTEVSVIAPSLRCTGKRGRATCVEV